MALSPERLAADLRALGVAPGAVLEVHASLRAVGPVDGGAEGVIAAIDAAVGPEGTWLMAVGVADDHAWVNERPEAERPALLAGATPFDAARTPADPDVGVLAEVVRRHPGTWVSDHPEGRMAARGRHAEDLVVDVPWDHYYGPGSPLDRLVALGGEVLRLGADLDTVTLLHLAEHLCSVPEKRSVRRHRLMATPEGPRVVVVETLDDSDGIVDLPGEDYFARLLRGYLATGRAATGRVGGADSELIGGADLLAFAVAWMDDHLGP